MTGSTEGRQVDDSSVAPGPTAFRPPLRRRKSERLRFNVAAGHISASLNAVMHDHGNSPIGFVLVVLASAAISAGSVVLCRWWPASGWVTFVVAIAFFIGVTAVGIQFISCPPRNQQSQRRNSRSHRSR